jgi:hypothetical protein
VRKDTTSMPRLCPGRSAWSCPANPCTGTVAVLRNDSRSSFVFRFRCIARPSFHPTPNEAPIFCRLTFPIQILSKGLNSLDHTFVPFVWLILQHAAKLRRLSYPAGRGSLPLLPSDQLMFSQMSSFFYLGNARLGRCSFPFAASGASLGDFKRLVRLSSKIRFSTFSQRKLPWDSNRANCNSAVLLRRSSRRVAPVRRICGRLNMREHAGIIYDCAK